MGKQVRQASRAEKIRLYRFCLAMWIGLAAFCGSLTFWVTPVPYVPDCNDIPMSRGDVCPITHYNADGSITGTENKTYDQMLADHRHEDAVAAAFLIPVGVVVVGGSIWGLVAAGRRLERWPWNRLEGRRRKKVRAPAQPRPVIPVRADQWVRDVKPRLDTGGLVSCSFCGKSQDKVKKLVTGRGMYICDACVELCNEITGATVAQVRRESNSAIDAKDSEKAAVLADTEKQLLARKSAREAGWKAGDMHLVADGVDRGLPSCSFCGKPRTQVKKLIARCGVYICDACIDACNEINGQTLAEPAGAESLQGDHARPDESAKARTRMPGRRVRNGVLISRQQARTESWQRIAVKTPAGETVVGTFKLLPGLKNRKTIRIQKVLLEKGLPGHHAWPDDGVAVRIRVPNWRLRTGLAALIVMAGIAGGAGRYAAVFTATWAVAAFCARYGRLHGVDRFDPVLRRRFWPMFRVTLAETALLYLVPVAAAIAVYLCAALVISRVRGVLTVRQLVSVQDALSSASSFFDRWVKLGDRPLLLVLLGAYLITSLLLAWRDRVTYPSDRVPGDGPPASQPVRPAGRTRRIRYGAAVTIRRAVQVHGRYSGPAAAALATLASFTFLVNIAAPLGTQLRLQAVDDTRDYKYAAQQVQEQLEQDLAARVVSLLYAKIQAAMPSGYQQILPEGTFTHQVDSIQQNEQQDVLPLQDSDPAAWQAVTAEQVRIAELQNLPGWSVINSPYVADAVAATRGDISANEIAAARDRASSAPADNRVELISDSGKEVVLQLGNTVSAPFWDKVKEQVKNQFPLWAPMVDALSDAVSSQLLGTLGEKVAPLVDEVIGRAADVKGSIAAAARNIADSVNIQKLIGGYSADASQITAQRQATLAQLSAIPSQMQQRADIIEGLTTGLDFDASISKVLTLSPSLQSAVVNDLMAMVQDSADQTRMAQIYQQQDYVQGDPTTLQSNAASAIETLAPSLPGIVTPTDLSIADPD